MSNIVDTNRFFCAKDYTLKLAKAMTELSLARTGGEAQRLIKGGGVRVGYCSPECSFFKTGRCDCGGWRKVTNPVEEVASDLVIKVGDGFGRLVLKLDGTTRYDWLWSVARVP